MTEPIVEVSGLSKRFRRASGAIATAVDDVSFTLTRGEFLVLLGPSGCGKTTLLRMIAGLEEPDSGTIEIGGRAVYSHQRRVMVAPERRDIGMIFQSYALWPHMTVAQNVAYPLQNKRKLPKTQIADRVATILDLVHIGDLAGQYPAQMSGGQQQRVALARALVGGNDLVLFDEPLSNVDAKVREQLRGELLSMQRELGFSAIYVTHDQQEAMGLAHRIAVMETGRLAQLATPRELYHAAATRYVANFVGTSNEVPGTVESVDAANRATVRTSVGDLVGVPGPDDLNVGDEVIALFRPERAGSAGSRVDGVNVLDATVESALFLGVHTEYVVRVGEHRFRIWSTDDDLAEGARLPVGVAPTDVRILRP